MNEIKVVALSNFCFEEPCFDSLTSMYYYCCC